MINAAPLKFWATNRLLCTIWKTVESGRSETLRCQLEQLKTVDLFDATLLAPSGDNGRELDNMLTLGALLGRTSVVRLLLSFGASVRLVSNWDVLHSAVAGKAADCELIRMLIDAGANVNAADPECCGRTPLTIAVRQKNLDIARLLLSRGSRVDDVGYQHYSALCIAASLPWLSGLRLLIDNGADPLLATGPGSIECCPLVCLVKALPKSFSEADTDLPCSELLDYLMDVTLSRCSAERDRQIYLNLGLSAAVRWSKHDCFAYFLHRGASPNTRMLRAGSYESPVIFSAIFSNDEWMCRMLIDFGADVNVVENPVSGLTPVNFAAMLQFYPILRLLISAGADIEATMNLESCQSCGVTALGASLGAQPETLFSNVGLLLLRCNASIRPTIPRLIANGFDLLHSVKSSNIPLVLRALYAGGLAFSDLRNIDASDREMYRWRQWTCSVLSLKEVSRACIRRCMKDSTGKRFGTAVKDLMLPLTLQHFLLLGDVALNGLNLPENDIEFLYSLSY